MGDRHRQLMPMALGMGIFIPREMEKPPRELPRVSPREFARGSPRNIILGELLDSIVSRGLKALICII